MPEEELKELYGSLNLAMTFKDFQHIQNYFKNEEKRDPSGAYHIPGSERGGERQWLREKGKKEAPAPTSLWACWFMPWSLC